MSSIDVQDFQVTPLGAEARTVPVVRIEGRLLDSQSGQVLADFTGPNAILFPEDSPAGAAALAAIMEEFMPTLAMRLMRAKAGL